MNRLAYIAGPYAAGTPAEVAVNVHRAVALGHLAALCGHAPVVPHAMGAMGVYGDPSERGGVSRALALRCGRDLAEAVGAAGGALWVIEHDGGSLSAGTAIELDAFRRGRDREIGRAGMPSERVLRQGWAAWERELRNAGLAITDYSSVLG